jgi:GT2 family glycosyltransferase
VLVEDEEVASASTRSGSEPTPVSQDGLVMLVGRRAGTTNVRLIERQQRRPERPRADHVLTVTVAPCVEPAFLAERAKARGKFLETEEKLYIRGVSYGSFRPGVHGDYPDPATVAADFAAMSGAGFNTVRIYTAPPTWLLDCAADHGLRVMVGLAWEQHVAFLDDRATRRSIETRVRAGVAACARHPAILCYAIGNEIPAPIVRWYGARRVERFLERLYLAAKEEDPEGLVTYVNYPSTEYLLLPFLDLVCFNVFLEDEESLGMYLRRLQNLAGDRPLLITELGLDGARHGDDAQATSLEWQLRTVFWSGSAGAVVFSWTDEWHRGGADVDGWKFGLTDRERRPKIALSSVSRAFEEEPFRIETSWPRVSVIVCSHNGADTLPECLAGLARLEYPDYETVVVDDGSSDGTAEVAERFGVRLIRTAHMGLAAARNEGLEAARGEVVAYIDDDAAPDTHWLRYAVATLLGGGHAGVGGPNLPPSGQGAVAAAVALAPGGPAHVLLTDGEAEHIPGCNMVFWRNRLVEVEGFNPSFRVAGDDVDICWRLHERGWTIGFSPSAVVWHRRRNSVRAFLRQQRAYGRAEALLEQAWPEKYNLAGHLSWRGRIYGEPRAAGSRRRRIRYGTWGSGLFQSIYDGGSPGLGSLPLMPEWYMLIAALAVASTYELLYEPLFVAVPGVDLPLSVIVLAIAVTALAARAVKTVLRSSEPLRVRTLAVFLSVLQPLARLSGRLIAGLTPWRGRGRMLAFPWRRTRVVWRERWLSPLDRLGGLAASLRHEGAAVRAGESVDRWDLDVRTGPLGGARLLLAVEEHGRGRQLVRHRIWPRWSRGGLGLAAFFGVFAAVAAEHALATTTAVLAALAATTLFLVLRDCASGVALCLRVVEAEEEVEPEEADPPAEHFGQALMAPETGATQ